ncbi:hypothetical protein GCM10027589_53520 [Actinocorallia lasiicapitis]
MLRDVACWYLGEASRERLKLFPDPEVIRDWESRCDFVLLERDLLDIADKAELERIMTHYTAVLTQLIDDYQG